MIGLLINLIIIGLIVSVLLWGLSQLPIVEPIKGIIRIIIIVIFAIWLISLLGSMVGSFPAPTLYPYRGR
jgi:hypothetical protein